MKYFDLYKFNPNRIYKKHKMTSLKEKKIEAETVYEGTFLTLKRGNQGTKKR